MDGVIFNDLNIGSICRICLKHGTDNNDMISIIDQMEHTDWTDRKTIQDVLVDISAVKVEALICGIKLPMVICMECMQLLKLVVDFMQQCHKSQEVLDDYINKKNANSLGQIKEEINTIKEEIDYNSDDECAHYEDSYDKPTEQIMSNPDEKSIIAQQSEPADDVEADVQGAEEHLLLEDIKLNSQDRLFKCVECHRVFTKEFNYERHVAIHKGKDVACSLCKRVFPNSNSLAAHAKIHEKCECKFCGKEITRKAFEYHVRTHTGIRPYLCPECGKGFTGNSQLNSHLKTHTKERPFVCTICGKTMSKRSHLTRHLRTHTGERPFECSICGKRFLQNSEVNSHIRAFHQKEKPYTCDVCGKKLSKKSHYERHVRTHTGERPYKCSHCDKTFLAPRDVRIHESTHART